MFPTIKNVTSAHNIEEILNTFSWLIGATEILLLTLVSLLLKFSTLFLFHWLKFSTAMLFVYFIIHIIYCFPHFFKLYALTSHRAFLEYLFWILCQPCNTFPSDKYLFPKNCCVLLRVSCCFDASWYVHRLTSTHLA